MHRLVRLAVDCEAREKARESETKAAAEPSKYHGASRHGKRATEARVGRSNDAAAAWKREVSLARSCFHQESEAIAAAAAATMHWRSARMMQRQTATMTQMCEPALAEEPQRKQMTMLSEMQADVAAAF